MSQYLQSFKLKIYSSNGDEFQRFFESIMYKYYGEDFQAVAPNGSEGDGGNDGWVPKRGIYFQVYGPLNIIAKNRFTYAYNKLLKDFNKLQDNWSKIEPIKKYYFVINDKYARLSKYFLTRVHVLNKRQEECEVAIITASNLEDYFLSLKLSDQKAVIETNTYPEERAPEIVHQFTEVLIGNLFLNSFPRINENLIAYSFSERLYEALDNITQSLSLFKIPSEFESLRESAFEFIDRTKLLKRHFDSYEFCTYILKSRSFVKIKSWKRNKISDDQYTKFSEQNEKWERDFRILHNNLAHAANLLFMEIRKYHDKNFLSWCDFEDTRKFYFAQDQYYDVVDGYLKI